MAIYDYKGNNLSYSIYGNIADINNYGDISTASGFVNAFNKAIKDNGISGISIPKGEYNINSTLHITRDNFIIDGNQSHLNMRTDNGTPINADCFRVKNHNKIIIKNFLINMRQNKNSTAGTTFYFLDANHITVENIYVYQIGCRGGLIYNADDTSDTAGCTKIFFKNVNLNGIDEQNVNIPEWPCGIIGVNLKQSGYENCVVRGMSRFALEFKNYTTDSHMLNNTIYGSSIKQTYESGIAIGGDRPQEETVLGDNITILGNVIKNCRYPIYLGRTNNSVFNGNIINGQMHLEKVNNCVFSGNEVTSNTIYNMPLININDSSNITINGCLFDPLENELTDMQGTNTNIQINGFMNGNEINIINPT